MLWYKAWLETRVRFLISLIFITLFCSLRIGNNGYLQIAIWWLIAITPLTMGGVLREKSVGAAMFTLALPFSRTRLVAVRMAMSLMQAMALMVVPWAAVFTIGSLAGRAHSFPQALLHLELLAGGGIVLFAIGFLVSSVVEGEYTAPLVSAGIVTMFFFAQDGPTVRTHSPVLFMLGTGQYDVPSGLLTGTFPSGQIAVYALVAAILLSASVKAIQRREF